MFRVLFITLLVSVLFSIGCSDNIENKSDKKKITTYETLTLTFANLEFEDTEEEKKIALESIFFTLTKLKSKRKFTDYRFSGDSIHNSETIRKISKSISDIKTGRDTVNAVHVIFDDQTPIEFFVKTYKIFIKEKPECVANAIEEGMYGWYMNQSL